MANQAELRAKVQTAELPPNEFIRRTVGKIGKSMVEDAARVKPGQNVFILYDPAAMPLAQEVLKNSLGITENVILYERHLEEDAQMAARINDEAEMAALFQERAQMIASADVMIEIRGVEDPGVVKRALTAEQDILYQKADSRSREPLFDGRVHRTLFFWPTEREAKIERLTYEQYWQLVAKACDQPWPEIKQAQARLIEKLNAGKTLELVANEDDPDESRRTHLTMSIEGMTFANSTAYKNYPGSEVFSAPVRESVNGQIFAEGLYEFNGKKMRDIRLKIVNGKIVEAEAAYGNEDLHKILNTDEGARFFGEVALGTNPGLTRRMLNPLYNEKTGGSFHMAIGGAYQMEQYDGEAVNVDNGNRSAVHWDMTMLMHPNKGGGRVVLDGEVIQENGRFLDPEFAILNPSFKDS